MLAYLEIVVDVTADDTSNLALEQLHKSSSKISCGLSSGVVFWKNRTVSLCQQTARNVTDLSMAPDLV